MAIRILRLFYRFPIGNGRTAECVDIFAIAAMLDVAWSARLRFRVAGANEDAVED